MKKVFSLMLLLATMLTFTACSSDDDEPRSTLSGTTWTSTSYFGDDVWVLEFSNKNSVEFYVADNNLNIMGSTYKGSYTLDGNVIHFNLIGFQSVRWIFVDGTLEGNSMKVRYGYESAGADNANFSRIFRNR